MLAYSEDKITCLFYELYYELYGLEINFPFFWLSAKAMKTRNQSLTPYSHQPVFRIGIDKYVLLYLISILYSLNRNKPLRVKLTPQN